MFYREPDRQSYPERVKRWMRLIGYDRVERRLGKCVDCVRYRTSLSGQFRVALISDLHYFETPGNRAAVLETLDWLRKLAPEYLLFGGDFAADACDLEPLRGVLAEFGKLPGVKLAVTGNWERGKGWLAPDFWKKFYAGTGIRLLDDECYSDSKIWLYAASDRSKEVELPPLPRPPEDNRPKLLLAHNPDTVVALDCEGRLNACDLALCGHTHGGQVRIPRIGALVSSSRYRFFDYGEYLHRNNRTRMVISAGMGNRSVNFRFCCHREVAILDFQGNRDEKSIISA